MSMSYKEIAEILNISVEQVKAAERTGLMKLKRNPKAFKLFLAYLELEKDNHNYELKLLKRSQ